VQIEFADLIEFADWACIPCSCFSAGGVLFVKKGECLLAFMLSSPQAPVVVLSEDFLKHCCL